MASDLAVAYSGGVDFRIPELWRLPRRLGPRPRSSAGLPFRQLEQLPPAGMIDRLHRMCLELPGIRSRESRLAAPGSRALWLAEPALAGPPDAFIDGREFCHLGEGAIHLTLPAADVESVVASGWAERHPIHSLGVYTGLVLVYSPRNGEELATAFSLVAHSWRFAGGTSIVAGICV